MRIIGGTVVLQVGQTVSDAHLYAEIHRVVRALMSRIFRTADKEVDIILDELMPIADKCYVTSVPNPRTMVPDDLAKMIESRGVKSTVLEKDYPLEDLCKDETEVLCIAGSLYLIKDITLKF